MAGSQRYLFRAIQDKFARLIQFMIYVQLHLLQLHLPCLGLGLGLFCICRVHSAQPRVANGSATSHANLCFGRAKFLCSGDEKVLGR